MATAVGSLLQRISAPALVDCSTSSQGGKSAAQGPAAQIGSNGRIFTRQQFTGLSRHQAVSVGAAGRDAGKVSRSRRRSGVVRVTASGGAGGSSTSLNDLPLYPFINNQGRIVPQVEPQTQATVFAIFDSNKKIQYIGFSKDIRNSLRTLMGRRPEFCYYFKLRNLNTLDQQLMLDIRKEWFSELGLPPVGNTEAAQRAMWEKPAESGSISERGRAAAATSKAKTLLQMMQDRGLKEEMVYDPALIEAGKCDVLPSKGQSEEELAQQAEANAQAASLMRHVAVPTPSGEVVEFDINFQRKYVTNGGWMFDVSVTKDEKETRHRVILGRIFTDAAGIPEEEFVERVFAFLLHNKMPRRTEGVLASDQFAVNYFAVSEVAQKFPEFKEWFSQELPEAYWRFNRIHTYGEERSPVVTETKQFTPQY